MLTQETLKNIAQANPTSQVIFNTLANRQRFRRATNITKMENDLKMKGERVVEDEFIDAFRKLQDEGIGRLVFGRNGKPNRFKWNYNLRSVAQAAKDGTANLVPLSHARISPVEKKSDSEPQIVLKKRGRPAKKPLEASKPVHSIVINIDSSMLEKVLSLINSK